MLTTKDGRLVTLMPSTHGEVQGLRWRLFNPKIKPPMKALVAVMGGEIVGYAAFTRGNDSADERRATKAEIHTLEVSPSMRRLGIGTMLVGSVVDGTHEQVAICVCENGPRFFGALGFEPTGDFADWMRIV